MTHDDDLDDDSDLNTEDICNAVYQYMLANNIELTSFNCSSLLAAVMERFEDVVPQLRLVTVKIKTNDKELMLDEHLVVTIPSEYDQMLELCDIAIVKTLSELGVRPLFVYDVEDYFDLDDRGEPILVDGCLLKYTAEQSTKSYGDQLKAGWIQDAADEVLMILGFDHDEDADDE